MASSLAVVAMILLAALSLSAQQSASVDAQQGPPQFVTLPIPTRIAPAGLENGHFTFNMPTPLAAGQSGGTFSPANFTAPNLIGGPTNYDVSNNSSSYEGETGGASGNGVLVSGSNHIYPGNCSASATGDSFGNCAPYAYVSSSGTSWTRSILPRLWNGTTFGIGFDPAVDYDGNGTFYYSYGVAPLSGSYPNAVVVVKSTNGINWTQTAPVTFNRNKFFDDKYYLAINRSNGCVYVSWDRNTATNQILLISHSCDGGSTWTTPVKVNDGTSNFERVIGAYPAVDQASGTVYDSWHDYSKNIIFVDKSGNGGNTWGKDVAAATTHTGFGKDIGCVGGRSQGPAHHLKAGSGGALYLVYADAIQGRGFDILFTKSTDGGQTWSTPVTLNDDSTANDQFHPTLSVVPGTGGSDTLTVTFYDRRDDSNNCLAHVYATQSSDGGGTWSVNARQTSVASNFNGNPNGPGDYSSSSPFGATAWPFFSDHRNPDFEVFTLGVQ